jgi:transposase InsO family protein
MMTSEQSLRWRERIVQRLTKPYSPTTTGKPERWHQTLQLELLSVAGPFASVEDAQAAVDVWREEYNHRRPHQSLDMACPAGRFRPTPADDGLELWAPPTWSPSPPRLPALRITR